MRHAEGEHRKLGPVEALRIEQRSRAEQLDDIGACRLQLLGQLAVSAADPGRCRQHPLLQRRVVERVQEELEPAAVEINPGIQGTRMFRREFGHLQRQERALVTVQVQCADPHDGHVETPGQDRVELRDAARPWIQVIPGDTVDQDKPQGSGPSLGKPRLRSPV